MIGISGSLIWSKTLMELIFNPCGEFRRAQSAKSSFLTSSLVPVGSFQFSSDAKERVGCGKQREATAPIKSLAKLQPRFLSLWWKTWLRQNCSLGSSACSEGPAFGHNTLMIMIIISILPKGRSPTSKLWNQGCSFTRDV